MSYKVQGNKREAFCSKGNASNRRRMLFLQDEWLSAASEPCFPHPVETEKWKCHTSPRVCLGCEIPHRYPNAKGNS